MYKPFKKWVESMLIKKFFVISILLAGLTGCGAGIGDVCGSDAGGLHGETECSEGICMYDSEQDQSICKEDNLAPGDVCDGHAQCRGFEQQQMYCQREAFAAKLGQCAKPLVENEACHPLAICGAGLFCFNGVCLPPQDAGGPCQISKVIKHCKQGLVCGLPDGLTLPLDEMQREGLDPSSGKCRVGGKAQEPCDDSLGIGCAPGYNCRDVDNVCVAIK